MDMTFEWIQEAAVALIVLAAALWLLRRWRRRRANPCGSCECCSMPDPKEPKKSATPPDRG